MCVLLCRTPEVLSLCCSRQVRLLMMVRHINENAWALFRSKQHFSGKGRLYHQDTCHRDLPMPYILMWVSCLVVAIVSTIVLKIDKTASDSRLVDNKICKWYFLLNTILTRSSSIKQSIQGQVSVIHVQCIVGLWGVWFLVFSRCRAWYWILTYANHKPFIIQQSIIVLVILIM
jgi:hypothetical protein